MRIGKTHPTVALAAAGIQAAAALRIPAPGSSLRRLKDLGKAELPIERSGWDVIVPIGNRAYLAFADWSRNDGIDTRQRARLQPGGGPA